MYATYCFGFRLFPTTQYPQRRDAFSALRMYGNRNRPGRRPSAGAGTLVPVWYKLCRKQTAKWTSDVQRLRPGGGQTVVRLGRILTKMMRPHRKDTDLELDLHTSMAVATAAAAIAALALWF